MVRLIDIVKVFLVSALLFFGNLYLSFFYYYSTIPGFSGGLEAEALAPGGQAGAKGQRQTLEQEMPKFCRWPGEAAFAEPGSRHSFDHLLFVLRFPASWALLGKRFSAGP